MGFYKYLNTSCNQSISRLYTSCIISDVMKQPNTSYLSHSRNAHSEFKTAPIPWDREGGGAGEVPGGQITCPGGVEWIGRERSTPAGTANTTGNGGFNS